MNAMRKKWLMKKFRIFFGNIKQSDKIAFIYDTDGDGTCSAALMEYALRKKRGKGADLFLYPERGRKSITKELQERIIKEKIGILFIFDIPVDNNREGLPSLKKLLKRRKVIKICEFDHHNMDNDLSRKYLFIKSILFERKYNDYCTTKLVHDFLSYFMDMGEKEWVTATGIISDCSKIFASFIRRANRKYGAKKLISFSHFINTVYLKDERHTIKAIRLMASDKPFTTVSDMFRKYFSRNYNDVINESKKLQKKIEELDFSGEIIFADSTAKYRTKAIVLEKTSEKYPHKTLLFYRRDKDGIHVSVRRKDGKVNTPELLKKSTEGMRGATAGGHIVASGCYFPARYLKIFINNIRKYHDLYKIS